MRVVVIGAGSMGLRHIKNLVALGQKVLTVETDPAARSRAEAAGAAYWNIQPMPDAEVVATPPWDRPLTPMPALIEKPIAMTAATARKFETDSRRLSGTTWAVGYNLRFDPSLAYFRDRVQADDAGAPLSARVVFGQSLADWRPGVPPETLPYARTGILLEASHEIDAIRWIFGDVSVVGAWVGRRRWDIAVDDTAIGILHAGIPIELHLDMTHPGYRRSIELIGADRTLTWSFDRQVVEYTYREELRAFLGWVQTGIRDERLATFADGIAALDVIDAMKAVSA